MDALRPDSDELDRFNQRSSSKSKNKSGSGRQPSNQGPKSKSQGPLLIFVILIVIGLSSGFAWVTWQQHTEIAMLKSRLSDASGFMDQSKLLIARLEGRLSETGVELAETGTAAEKKLAFLDSEMRKLWVIAYEKNRVAIEKSQKQLDAFKSKLAKLEQDNDASIKGLNSSLSALKTNLSLSLASVSSELSVLRAEQDKLNASFDARIVSQKNRLDKYSKESAAYLERAAKFDLSIESINASRRQLNARIVELDEKLNALQLKISSPPN